MSSVLILNSIDTPEKDEAGLSLFISCANFSGTRKWEKSSLSASTQYVNLSPIYCIINPNIKWNHEPESFNHTIAYRQKTGKTGLIKILANYTMDYSSMYYHDLNTRMDDLISLKNNDLFIVSSYKGTIGKNWIVSSGASYNFDIEKIDMDEDNIETTKQSYEFKLTLTKPLITLYAVLCTLNPVRCTLLTFVPLTPRLTHLRTRELPYR